MNIVFYSGGAEGIDYTSETLAQRFLPDSDYRIISFKEHTPRTCCFGEVFRIQPYMLKEVDSELQQASNLLNKRIPTKIYSKNLLRRNFYQVASSDVVLAFSNLEKNQKNVKGGTGWTVEYAKLLNIPIFLCESDGQWFFWDDIDCIFKKHNPIPNFQKATTIVGTRVPEYSQKIALERVFTDYVKRQISTNVTNP